MRAQIHLVILRILWILRPVFLVLVMSWLLLPSTGIYVAQNSLWAFLFGCIVGFIMFKKTLLNYLIERPKQKENVPKKAFTVGE